MVQNDDVQAQTDSTDKGMGVRLWHDNAKYRTLCDLAYSEGASIEITATCMERPLKTDCLQRYYGASEVEKPHLWS